MYLLLRLNEWFMRNYWDASTAFMEWNLRFCSRKLGERRQGYEDMPDWKQTALEDFRVWLDDLPGTMKNGKGTTPDSCDLYTLLSEFSGLRGEIRMQNREQRKAIETLSSFIGAYQEAWDVFKERSEGIAELEERIREAAEKRTLMPLLSVRDALVRGRDAGRELGEAAEDMASRSKGFFRSSPKGMDHIAEGVRGMVEGYEMAIRRFDGALELVGIRPLDAVGRPFDPATMKAVGRRSVSDMEEGMIIEEHVTGFVRGEEVLRLAEVVVAAEVVAQMVVNE